MSKFKTKNNKIMLDKKSSIKGQNKAIFSFFSGAGFLDLGFEYAGYTISFVNEIHKPFLNSYIYAREQMGTVVPSESCYLSSIDYFLTSEGKKKLTFSMKQARSEGSIIGFIGGPPCPDFSVGGKNKGREGKNGILSKIYVDLIIQQRPDFFVFENVKGLWRTKKHRDFFDELKQRLHSAGYVTTERLINSIEYGAPQDRDRIILVGFLKKILPNSIKIGRTKELAANIFPWEKMVKFPREQVFNLKWPTMDKFIDGASLEKPDGITEELTVEFWFNKNKVLQHPNAKHFFQPRAALSKFKKIPEGDVQKKSFKRLHRWRYSPTAAYGNNEVHIHPYMPRRLSVAEALAVQSLPMQFSFPATMTLSDMFKAVGNGVPFMAARGLAETINLFLNSR